jgi:hypothetical protein
MKSRKELGISRIGNNERGNAWLAGMSNQEGWASHKGLGLKVVSISPTTTTAGLNFNLTINLNQTDSIKNISLIAQDGTVAYSANNLNGPTIVFSNLNLPNNVYTIKILDKLANTILNTVNTLTVGTVISSYTTTINSNTVVSSYNIGLTTITTVLSGYVQLNGPGTQYALGGFPATGSSLVSALPALPYGNYTLNLLGSNGLITGVQTINVLNSIVSWTPTNGYLNTAFTISATLNYSTSVNAIAQLVLVAGGTTYTLNVNGGTVGTSITFNPVTVTVPGNYVLVITDVNGNVLNCPNNINIINQVQYNTILLPNGSLSDTVAVVGLNNGLCTTQVSSLNLGAGSAVNIAYEVAFTITYGGSLDSYNDFITVGICDGTVSSVANSLPPSNGFLGFSAGSSSNIKSLMGFSGGILLLQSFISTAQSDVVQFREYYNGTNLVFQYRVNTGAWTTSTTFGESIFSGLSRYLCIVYGNSNLPIGQTRTFVVTMVANP